MDNENKNEIRTEGRKTLTKRNVIALMVMGLFLITAMAVFFILPDGDKKDKKVSEGAKTSVAND
nr:hypothetical protein [Lachnospiraceae bacterium]